MIIGGCSTKYTMGVDFGTERGWAVLLDVSWGRELATSVHSYANGVMDDIAWRRGTIGARLGVVGGSGDAAP
jgi:hypothetical protein